MVVATTRPSTEELQSSAKRIKSAEGESQIGKFHAGLFDQASRDALRTTIASSKPYQHCKIDKLVDDDLLRRVRKEIFDNISFTAKETDIYKVNQSGDLANIDGLPEDEKQRLSSLFELRNAIYSNEFREFISDITGCGPLSPSKMDMSVNTYTEGCHLLNHDDVIGTRRVSFILYMPDPDEPWYPSYGGALELYPVVERDTPAIEPSVSVPPKWNQFAMFTVLPGYSFHAVEEVVVEGKPRLSIQGWFHFPQPGDPGYDEKLGNTDGKSSLKQLEEQMDTSDNFNSYVLPMSEEEDVSLTEQDREALAAWMNPTYLNATSLQQISDRFLDESAIQLKDFLLDDLYEKMKKVTLQADQEDGLTKPALPSHGAGLHGKWVARGSPVCQRFLAVDIDCERVHDASSQLFTDLKRHFESEPFRRWLAVVSQLIPGGYRGAARRFRPGLDYTLAKANTLGKAVLDVTFCHATISNADSLGLWDSGECGGYECYMAPHEGDDDAATYKAADEEGALLTMPAGNNELALVLRDEGVMRFIKYVSGRAPGSRWDVAFEYDLQNL
ncbi:Oxoglutarate and iron-dependent oxygenase degradation C-term-domain-containing protein [Radiomyces spectabilis]|uniref:Oxoglutarate and iron-dependent oxygenase degradation C-term-domain-containing protein n=1 Tax=Radiomyces spectabilis TaxID=64574 RepID=UPI0022206770|nr:Oxoglutarate and iron-dependent oxygenase degradation C-term-domain-containing protein [Radiomyces spectabilis]KAI8370317.1 Oxoglutarate and iron-dependent oxygenase degradation C-term-domain-containing protein [Radiomyces spectabilis]